MEVFLKKEGNLDKWSHQEMFDLTLYIFSNIYSCFVKNLTLNLNLCKLW
jgi:hypothetical protein